LFFSSTKRELRSTEIRECISLFICLFCERECNMAHICRPCNG
jgi:hypothetical protein